MPEKQSEYAWTKELNGFIKSFDSMIFDRFALSSSFMFPFVFSAPTGADLPKSMLIAYLLSPGLFNLLTDHFLFRDLQQFVSHLLPYNICNTLCMIHIILYHQTTLKDGRKKADGLESQGPKEWHISEFPRTSFCLLYSDLGLNKSAMWKCQWL